MDEHISKIIDKCIQDAIKRYNGSYELGNPFEELLSFGELVDRLSIVNFKLYTLKNEVIRRDSDQFKAWASVEDVRLVKERARLKRCIDDKLNAEVKRLSQGISSFNAESKLYE